MLQGALIGGLNFIEIVHLTDVEPVIADLVLRDRDLPLEELCDQLIHAVISGAGYVVENFGLHEVNTGENVHDDVRLFPDPAYEVALELYVAEFVRGDVLF